MLSPDFLLRVPDTVSTQNLALADTMNELTHTLKHLDLRKHSSLPDRPTPVHLLLEARLISGGLHTLKLNVLVEQLRCDHTSKRAARDRCFDASAIDGSACSALALIHEWQQSLQEFLQLSFVSFAVHLCLLPD